MDRIGVREKKVLCSALEKVMYTVSKIKRVNGMTIAVEDREIYNSAMVKKRLRTGMTLIFTNYYDLETSDFLKNSIL